MGVLDPQEGEIWRVEPPSRLQPKHATANCSQTVSPVLPPGEYKPAIPPFPKLLRAYFSET